MWLAILVGALVLSFGLCVCSLSSGRSTTNGEIDLEAVSRAYAGHVASGSRDLKSFEQRINKPEIYKGKGYVNAVMDGSGTVIGYVDKDNVPGYQKSNDIVVFRLEAEHESQSLVANDAHNHYYRHRSPSIFQTYLMLRMLDNQRGYYGGRYYRAPTGVSYVSPGYFHRPPVSTSRGYSSGSKSIRTGSSGTRRSTGGGFGSGK